MHCFYTHIACCTLPAAATLQKKHVSVLIRCSSDNPPHVDMPLYKQAHTHTHTHTQTQTQTQTHRPLHTRAHVQGKNTQNKHKVSGSTLRQEGIARCQVLTVS